MRSTTFLASLILHGAFGVVVAWWVPMERSGMPGVGGSTAEFNAFLLDSPAEAAEEPPSMELESFPEKSEPEPEPQLGIEFGSPVITAEKALADLPAPSIGVPNIEDPKPLSKTERSVSRSRRSNGGVAGSRAGGGGGTGRYSPPRYARCPAPSYPAAAREARQSGLALLRVSVDSDGGVVRVALARSTGSKVLDNVALATVRTWRFVPAQLDARPVAAEVEVPVRFVF
jgi:TonB family protein